MASIEKKYTAVYFVCYKTEYTEKHTKYTEKHTKYTEKHTKYTEKHTRYTGKHTKYTVYLLSIATIFIAHIYKRIYVCAIWKLPVQAVAKLDLQMPNVRLRAIFINIYIEFQGNNIYIAIFTLNFKGTLLLLVFKTLGKCR